MLFASRMTCSLHESLPFIPQDTSYLVKPESCEQAIQPNKTFVAGYCANKTDSNYKPSQVKRGSHLHRHKHGWKNTPTIIPALK